MKDDLRQRRGYGWVHLGRRHRHPSQVIVDEPQGVARTERRRPGRQFVQRCTQRVEIGALVHRPAGAPGGLGREVRQRPHDLRRVGDPRAHLRHRRPQGEVHQAGGALNGDDNVRWADVPVHHPAAVHRGHRPGHRHRQPEQLLDR